MELIVKEDAAKLGVAAGKIAAEYIRDAIHRSGEAHVILATGASQFETLKQLVKEDLEWDKVVMFHLDEYLGLPETHPASFRKYLRERFVDKVSGLKDYFLINGEAPDPEAERLRLSKLIASYPIDVALVGIGENGHLAFNDPPADFETREPYLVVNLDEACRRQQLNEGWFGQLSEVPNQAISMSVNHILESKKIICSVPGSRKAEAVQHCFESPVSNRFPASILRSHEHCTVYLDTASAALLSDSIRHDKQNN